MSYEVEGGGLTVRYKSEFEKNVISGEIKS